METPTSSFKLRANAPEAPKRFPIKRKSDLNREGEYRTLKYL